MKHDTAAVNQ